MPNVSNIKAITFVPQAVDDNALAQLQTLGGAGNFNLNGVHGVALGGAPAGNDGSNLATTVTFTSTGNISGVTMTVTGTDANGDAQSENIAGPNNNTVTTTNAFLTVTQVAADGAVGTNTKIGFTATTTGTGPVFRGRTKIRGMHGFTDGVAGNTNFNDGSTTGTTLYTVYTGAAEYDFEPYVPDNGVLFPNGAFVDMDSTQKFEGLTVYFDG
jgi:hypothetical protein